MSKRKTLGVRNNNPLNMREVGIDWNGKTGQNAGFTTFETPFYGIRAASNDIKNKLVSGVDSIAKLVSIWAPATENDTLSYIKGVASDAGMQAEEPITSFEQLVDIITAMIAHENANYEYSFNLVKRAVHAGITSGQPLPIYFALNATGDYEVLA
jgi:hypothetical protein